MLVTFSIRNAFTNSLGDNDEHISLYPWDWLLKHRRDMSEPINEEEKLAKADPYVHHLFLHFWH
jgi:hypothetical protein